MIYKIRLDEKLYEIYKNNSREIPSPPSMELNSDYEILKKYEKDMALLSPFSEEDTARLTKMADIHPSFVVSNNGRTKPSTEPYKRLFEVTGWDPLDVVSLSSSPLDLLSSRFYDSRIRVLCVDRNRKGYCERYSPTFIINSLNDMERALKILRVV